MYLKYMKWSTGSLAAQRAPTYNSGIRHTPKGVDLPQQDPITPDVRLGGEALQGEREGDKGWP